MLKYRISNKVSFPSVTTIRRKAVSASSVKRTVDGGLICRRLSYTLQYGKLVAVFGFVCGTSAGGQTIDHHHGIQDCMLLRRTRLWCRCPSPVTVSLSACMILTTQLTTDFIEHTCSLERLNCCINYTVIR